MLKKLLTISLSLILLLVPLSGCTTTSQSQSYDKTIATARTEIWKAISGGGASSATVAIMDNGKIVYEEGFAMANREEALKVNTSTQFNIGSVSKVFTAAAVMQLVEAGKVDLDKPVVDYVPEFTMQDSRYKNITVRMLLNHSSALPGTDYTNGFASAADPNFLEGFMKYLANSNLKDDPGVVSVYCNDGFTLAEVLIEKVSGQSYAEYVSKNIFTKADMKNSSCYFKPGNPNIALKYNNDNGLAFPAEYVNLMGTGGISSTAVDLCEFGNALLANKIMTPESFAEYTSPQYATETVPAGMMPITSYGLGWDMINVAAFEEQGIHVLSKNGGTLQFNSQLYVLPEQKLSVAVIFAGVADTASINNAITQALLEEKGVLPGSETKEVTKPGSAAIPDQLLGFAGYYGASGSIIKVEFDKQSNTLNYKQFNGSEFVSTGSYPYMDDGYFYLPSGNRMSFSESFDKKLMLQSLPTGNYAIVVGQQIGQATNPVDGSAFANKHWLPINFSATDLSPLAVATGTISDLPGFIYVSGDDSFTPYALKDANSAAMTLPYARDLVEPRITEVDGKKQLSVMSYICMNAQDITSMQNGETISIIKANENQIKKLDAAGTFGVTLPEGGRMIIYAPDFTISYDTLFSGSESVPVAAGSYVLFIGNEGDTFAYQYSF
nr:serine hydrolase domain-containing protein [uncultured Acetobacterium sp.]